MKKIIQLLFLLKCSILYSQNMVKNPSFENLKASLINYNCNAGGNCEPFSNTTNSYVIDWKSYINTPEIYQTSQNSIYDGNAAAFFKMFQSNGGIYFNEGIFQEGLNLKKDRIYTVNVSYWIRNNTPINSDNVSLKIIAANNLVNTNATSNNSVSTIETIGMSTDNRMGQWLQFTTVYIPTNDYAQVALFAVQNPNSSQTGNTQAEIVIDKVIITESCCQPFQDYSDITNPPSVNVQDYIKCNSNVTFNNSSYTELKAKEEILLANNTTISGVESFTASAEDCLAKPVEFYPNIEQAKCKFKVFLSACYGSGQYEFYFGEVLSETGNKDYAKENAGSSIVVKVKDIVTGTIISKTITFPSPIVYTGNFTLNIPNVFTPNGDGINDNFRITDNGKTRFAYNAHSYSLHIWNRWGDDVLLRQKSITDDDINGFNDQEIYWNGRNNGSNDNENTPSIVSDGTYYYNFSVTNCDKTEAFHGTITVIDGPSFTEKTNLEKNINEKDYDRKTEISPNPTNNILNVKLFSTKTKTNILITDMLGKQINTNCNLTADKDGLQEYNIDCSGMANGIYFCTISKDNTLETFKFSVIK